MIKLRIRLRSQGSTNNKSYRIVVINSRNKRDGEYVALVGHYIPRHPRVQEQLALRMDVFDHWIKNGALPTKAVDDLVKRFLKTHSSVNSK